MDGLDKKVLCFMRAYLHDSEFDLPLATDEEIERVIKADEWIEFPARVLLKILEEYRSVSENAPLRLEDAE